MMRNPDVQMSLGVNAVSDAVIITIIICATLVLISFIGKRK